MDGCNDSCVQRLHNISIPDIISYHNLFTELPRYGKKQWLLDYFKMNTSVNGETIYSICGHPVCFQVWLNTLGLSQSYFYKIRSMFKSGILQGNSEVKVNNSYINVSLKISEREFPSSMVILVCSLIMTWQLNNFFHIYSPIVAGPTFTPSEDTGGHWVVNFFH